MSKELFRIIEGTYNTREPDESKWILISKQPHDIILDYEDLLSWQRVRFSIKEGNQKMGEDNLTLPMSKYCPNCRSNNILGDVIGLDNKNIEKASFLLEHYACLDCHHEWADLVDIQTSLGSFLIDRIMGMFKK